MRVSLVVVNVEMGGGDGHAKGTRVAALLSPPLHPINNTPNNQSKPIVPTPSLSLSYNFSL